MRRKTRGGGKSRPVKSPTRRSQRSSSATARALPVFLSQDDESESREQADRTQKVVPETFSDSYSNGDNAGVVPYSVNNTVEKEVDLSAQIGNNNSEDSIREGTCIRCKGRDEKILVCGEIGCLIGVHEKCMGCNPWFDDSGKFYCPFCKQKRTLARVRESRRKVKDAKKALLSFLEGGKVDERNEPCKLPSAGDGICHDNENRFNGIEVENQFADVDKEDKQKGMENGEPGCIDQDTIVLENEAVQLNTSVVNSGDVGCRKEVSSGRACLSEMRGETLDDEQEEGFGPMEGSEDEKIGKDKEQTETFCTSHAVEEIIQEEQEEDLAPTDVSEYDKEATDALYTSHTAEERNAGVAVKVSKKGVTIEVSKNNEGIEDNEEQMRPETSDSPSNANAISETESLAKRHRRFKRRAGKVACVQNVSPSARSSLRLKKAFVRRKASANKNASAFYEKPTTSKMSRKSAKQHRTVNFHEARRKRLHWTAEEEEKLKEGVKVFSQMTNVNIPWRKILEYGRHVFHETRCPIDLKDKWRNIVDKEGARVNR